MELSGAGERGGQPLNQGFPGLAWPRLQGERKRGKGPRALPLHDRPQGEMDLWSAPLGTRPYALVTLWEPWSRVAPRKQHVPAGRELLSAPRTENNPVQERGAGGAVRVLLRNAFVDVQGKTKSCAHLGCE